MGNSTSVKAALVAALIAAAVLGRTPPLDGARAAMLSFGLANVLFSPQGTEWVRGAAVIAVIAALLQSSTLFSAVALLAWLVWPPAYVVAWATRRQRTANWDPATEDTATQARVALAAVIGAVAIGALVYRALVWHRLDQTAALFIGIPALLAIVVVFAVSPKSATGVACKAVTIGLLVSLLFLWEGMLCILMSAPLFFLVAVIIGQVAEYSRGRFSKPQGLFCSVAVLVLVPMSMEGVTERTSMSRNEEITQTRIVPASADAVTRAIFEVPRFERGLPLYLRAGFPRPTTTHVGRSVAGSHWIVRFRGGEMKANGMEPRAGDLVLELTESGPGVARWRAVADDSHMTHFLSWRESIVRWESVGAETTRVTWTIRYRRGLDPAWYFGPWERYAVRLATDYLIDTVATP